MENNNLTKSEKLKLAWVERKKTFIPPMKGKKMSEESRKKMSIAAKGRESNRLGKKHTLETRIKISQRNRENSPKGKDCHSYKDGMLSQRKGQRFSMEYRRWRFDVFSRDEFSCQHCGDKKGGNLVAHHVKHFSKFPELRFEIKNGITLCNACHKKIHKDDRNA